MAAAAQADRTERNAGGSSSRSLLRGRGRTIRCDPIGGAIHWNGSEVCFGGTKTYARSEPCRFLPRRVIWRHSLDLPIGLSRRPRDGSVVSLLHCMNDPQPEGSHGKLHPTTK